MALAYKDREQALKHIRNLDESKFPLVLDIWNADDIREGYTDEQGDPILTDAEVAEVVHRLADNFDAEYGITNERVWSCASYVHTELLRTFTIIYMYGSSNECCLDHVKALDVKGALRAFFVESEEGEARRERGAVVVAVLPGLHMDRLDEVTTSTAGLNYEDLKEIL